MLELSRKLGECKLASERGSNYRDMEAAAEYVSQDSAGQYSFVR